LSVRYTNGTHLALWANYSLHYVGDVGPGDIIGDLALAAWPSEIFAVSGLELKRRSPVKPLLNVGLANGWFGYVPPPEQFRLGAYETCRAERKRRYSH
jgi:hypothetical protein